MAVIEATIHVERDGQNASSSGRGGEKLKAVGTAARLRRSKSSSNESPLTLCVRVTADWTESESALADLGYGRDPT